MKTRDLAGGLLDYWVARSLHDFVREICFTDGGATVAIRGTDLGKQWAGRFQPSTAWEATSVVFIRVRKLSVTMKDRGEVLCDAQFASLEKSGEASGPTLQLALLRAFVLAVMGEEVDDAFPRQNQLLLGKGIDLACNGDTIGPSVEVPSPEGR